MTLTLTNIKILHLEPTSACNARCPQCIRETDLNFDKNTTTDLSLEKLLSLIDVNFIKGLDKMFMCGTCGDPAAGKYTLDIFRYFKSVNPQITLGMNTNGSLRNTQWWKDLANIMTNPKDYVVWSIDWLEDTNSIYRINTNWNKIIDNAKSFISAGGSAHWDILIFEHNQHQVEDSENLAKSLGFSWFRSKVSKKIYNKTSKFFKSTKKLECSKRNSWRNRMSCTQGSKFIYFCTRNTLSMLLVRNIN